VAESKLDLLQGTLDVMVLQTLLTMGAMHGYGIARRIEQVSGDEILLNQGTIYASLVRLQQRGWISRSGELRTITVRRSTTPLREAAASNWSKMPRTGKD
jgi:DNA-binding PadR family transcriptional regulator